MSIVDSVNNTGAHPFKTTMARASSRKILCAEAVTHLQTWDAPILDYPGGTAWVAETGRFQPLSGGTLSANGTLVGADPHNYLTCRHGSGKNVDNASAGQANVSFGDGHVGMVPWWYCTNANYVNPIQ
jgi:prepilin-type processing-associated H-X9-DG protein